MRSVTAWVVLPLRTRMRVMRGLRRVRRQTPPARASGEGHLRRGAGIDPAALHRAAIGEDHADVVQAWTGGQADAGEAAGDQHVLAQPVGAPGPAAAGRNIYLV